MGVNLSNIMEKYHKFIGGLILIAFFAAISIYVQKASATLSYYVENSAIINNMQDNVVRVVSALLTNFIG
jgi:hypothetical protein